MSAPSTPASVERGPARPLAANRCCGRCRHFVDDALELERIFPALLALSSAHGDSRGDQGLCRLHARWLLPRLSCEQFSPAP